MDTVVWITGASAGLGAALARAVPHADALVVDVSRSGGTAGTEHLAADLADPASWPRVAAHVRDTLDRHRPRRALFLHCAGTLEPIGPARDVDPAAYTAMVLLDSAAPQVLGQAFLAAAAAHPDLDATLLLVSSGAARTVYEGWSAYGAAKAACDQWVRIAGAEEARRGGARVLAVAPGVVATAMQAAIRATPVEAFPARDRFVALHEQGALADPDEVAQRLWALLDRDDLDSGAVLDLRDL